MKTNLPLQSRIGLGTIGGSASKVWYAANILRAACFSSPAVKVRDAVKAIPYTPARPAQTEKPFRAQSAPVAGINNTVGYDFGELYLNSPAYPIGTPIPAIPAKLSSAAVLAQPEILAQPALKAVVSPAIAALKGWEDAITIQEAVDHVTIVAELPINKGALLVGSDIEIIGEITPSLLQVNDWVANVESPGTASLYENEKNLTLEQFFYAHALSTNNVVVTDIIRSVNGVNIPCKKIEVQLGITEDFATSSDPFKLSEILYPVSYGS